MIDGSKDGNGAFDGSLPCGNLFFARNLQPREFGLECCDTRAELLCFAHGPA